MKRSNPTLQPSEMREGSPHLRGLKGIRRGLAGVPKGLWPAHLAAHSHRSDVIRLGQLLKIKILSAVWDLLSLWSPCHPGTQSLKPVRRTRALAVAETCFECRSVPPANTAPTDVTVWASASPSQARAGASTALGVGVKNSGEQPADVTGELGSFP